MRNTVLGCCWITFSIAAAAAPASGTKTFYKDILPILQAHCQNCHRPGEAAPFAMREYNEVRPWARAIKEVLVRKTMPPWFADGKSGVFKNDPSLPPAALRAIVAWVDAGAPAGDPRDAPRPLKFVEGWNIGQPDRVIEMPAAFNVPASGTLPYQWMVLPTGFKEDKWLTAIEIRPSNPRVVHHIAVFYRKPGSKWLAEAAPGVPVPKDEDGSEGGMEDGALGGYNPGMPPIQLPPGRAILLPSGADLVFQIHYTTDGKPQQDRSRIGMIFSKQPPVETEAKLFLATHDFVLRPGEANLQVGTSITLDSDLRFVNFTPHMHLRGKSFAFRAVFPDGRSETLLDVPRWDFNWQLTYELASERVLPKGTRIEAIAVFDNSANNPNNPDPSKEVRWGDQIWDEMMVGTIGVVTPIGADVRKLISYGPYAAPHFSFAQLGRATPGAP